MIDEIFGELDTIISFLQSLHTNLTNHKHFTAHIDLNTRSIQLELIKLLLRLAKFLLNDCSDYV